jgi:hypothetical protein
MKKTIFLLTLSLTLPAFSQIDSFLGEYTLLENDSGNCYEQMEVYAKDPGYDCQDTSLTFVGLPRGGGHWIHAACNFNLGEKVRVQENPMTGRKIDRVLTTSTLQADKVTSVSIHKGAQFYNRFLTFSTRQFTFEKFEGNLYLLNLADDKFGESFFCLYQKK